MRTLLALLLVFPAPAFAQEAPPADDRIHDIVAAVSAQRIEADIARLVSFGTRNTMSDTLSPFAFRISGHTDATGPETFNLQLSDQRANQVREYLSQKHGVEPGRLTIRAYGETRPIESNSHDDGRYANRRVEFMLDR